MKRWKRKATMVKMEKKCEEKYNDIKIRVQEGGKE